MLHLVRHGRPLVDPAVPAVRWELDPAGFDDVWALRDRLPAGAAWASSPEPKALATAQLLTDADVAVVPALREQERPAGWVEDHAGAVARALVEPDRPALPGWESATVCRDRVVAAVEALLREVRAEPGPPRDLVLVGHGTAWTLLAAHLRREPPDVEQWRALGMPGVLALPAPPMP